MDVGDKVVEELFGKEIIISIFEVLCNIWISGSAVSMLLQGSIFNVEEAELLEVMVEGEMNIHLDPSLVLPIIDTSIPSNTLLLSPSF